jgi:hypothetical protein
MYKARVASCRLFSIKNTAWDGISKMTKDDRTRALKGMARIVTSSDLEIWYAEHRETVAEALTQPASEAVDVETTQAEFEKFLVQKHLSNEKEDDVWGIPAYKHAHIASMWYAWQAAFAATGHLRQPGGKE